MQQQSNLANVISTFDKSDTYAFDLLNASFSAIFYILVSFVCENWQLSLLIETITEDFGFNSTSLLCTYITSLRSNCDHSMLLHAKACYVNCESHNGRSETMLSLLSLAVIRDNTFHKHHYSLIGVIQSTRNVVSVVFELCKLKPSLFAYLFIMPKRHT